MEYINIFHWNPGSLVSHLPGFLLGVVYAVRDNEQNTCNQSIVNTVLLIFIYIFTNVILNAILIYRWDMRYII